MCFSDLTAQILASRTNPATEEEEEELWHAWYEWHRSMQICIWAMFIHGPMMHVYYGLLESAANIRPCTQVIHFV